MVNIDTTNRVFVTARMLGTKDGIRQGVKVFEDANSIIVVGLRQVISVARIM